MSQPTWAQRERQELCRLLEEVGPDAPTLCGEWTTRDLTAHLIVREARPDAAIGIFIKPMSTWTDKIQAKAAQRPWAEMVHEIRTGPPTFSLFNLPKADELANTTEYFVHLEDVRRAEPEWAPRNLPPKLSDSLWKVLRSRAKMFYRHVPVGVVLQRTDSAPGVAAAESTVQAASGSPVVTISGPAQELLLFSFGRKDQSVVDVAGDNSSISQVMAAKMAV
ncbi:MAG: TIGR03085 family metal-binding protein [Candidatus Nanopelagicales bacterium]